MPEGLAFCEVVAVVVDKRLGEFSDEDRFGDLKLSREA
jgi:hypothetical protein